MTVPEPRTARAADHPCQLYGSHWPMVLLTQYHHSRPVYLQNRLYGRILYPADYWVCGTCHDSLHEVIRWKLDQGRTPNPMPGPRTNIMVKAMETVEWFNAEKVRLGKS
jgi:hypothetical protein